MTRKKKQAVHSKKQKAGTTHDASLLRRYLEPRKEIAPVGPLAWAPSVSVDPNSILNASPTMEYSTRENDEE